MKEKNPPIFVPIKKAIVAAVCLFCSTYALQAAPIAALITTSAPNVVGQTSTLNLNLKNFSVIYLDDVPYLLNTQQHS